MFNIVKILNSGASTPDVLRLPINADVAIKPGCALVIRDGAVACPTEGDVPELIVIEKVGENSITAYTATSGVVYRMKPILKTEVDAEGNATTEEAPAILERVGIAIENGIAVGIKRSGIGSGTVIGIDGENLLVNFR